MALDIEPAEGMIALRILDEVEEERGQAMPGQPRNEESYNTAILCLVLGVGKKVTNCKKGDTVLCRRYAKDGIRTDDTKKNVIVESYVVVAKVNE